MSASATDLKALSVRRGPNSMELIRPPRRWFSRYILPALLLAGFAGLCLDAAWDVIQPGTPVAVAPVQTHSGVIEAAGVELLSATGWLEPGPTGIEVPALTEGVVQELFVLPGQRVTAGQAIAQLIEADARLALQGAEQDLAERRLKVATAQADQAEAEAQARGADAAVRADEELYQNKLIGEARYLQTLAQRAVAQARIEQAKARLQEAQSRVRQGETQVEIAKLRLERTMVRTPVSGIVMSLNALPGRMVGVRTGTNAQPDTVITLYNPATLQVRTEVPIDKFQLVRPGQPAQVEVDVLPGQRLAGTVLYDTHETDIQRNTVRVKVGIDRPFPSLLALPLGCPSMESMTSLALAQSLDCTQGELLAPHAKLRPGMIARVRILAPPTANRKEGGEILRILVPRRLVMTDGGQSQIWIVDQSASRALLRPVTLGSGQQGELIEVAQGLQPSDKLIVSGRELLKPGQRVRIVGEE